MLTCSTTRTGCAGSLEYNADLFDAATIERLLGHLLALLAAAVADPRPGSPRLPLLSAAERAPGPA